MKEAYSPREGHWKFHKGGISKAKVFKGKYEVKQEFPEEEEEEGGGEGLIYVKLLVAAYPFYTVGLVAYSWDTCCYFAEPRRMP